MPRFKVAFLFVLTIFLSNLVDAQAQFNNPGPVSLCINGSYYLSPTTINGTFYSANSSVATVDSRGYVTGIAIGTTEVSLITDGGTVTASVTVGSTSSLTITDNTALPNYKFILNTPQGPQEMGAIINYVGYKGFTYSSQTRPTNTGYYRASKQVSNEAGCAVPFYIIKCDACATIVLSDILIGSQNWMEKNLDVTTYRNGDPIPQVTDLSAWANLTSGAWCYVNNDLSNNSTYGKLYNWYAVTDPRGLAPEGWHVPSDADFTILSNYLGGNSVAGNKMMSTGISLWPSPNSNATNSSGFTGVPGGYRLPNGGFNALGEWAVFWSSDVDSYDWQLRSNSSRFDKYPDSKTFGFSVRLLEGGHYIGQPYGGGIVAYIFVDGDPGYVAGKQHGLIAATSDQSSGIRWDNGSWVTTGATETVIGKGFDNTNTIISVQGTTSTSYAAGLARAHNGGGYNDWYLPSKDELHKLYLNRVAIGGFTNNVYWSSTEKSNSASWYESFEIAPFLRQSYATKGNGYNVRAIRTF